MMIDLCIEKFINARDEFKMHGKIFRLMQEKDKDHFHCILIDKYNFPQPKIVAKLDIPNSMQPYEFRITNSHIFEPGKAIFIYHKLPDRINKLQAIVVKCTPNMISFFYRDNGGEFKSLGLTARQIATQAIVVQMYPEPRIF